MIQSISNGVAWAEPLVLYLGCIHFGNVISHLKWMYIALLIFMGLRIIKTSCSNKEKNILFCRASVQMQLTEVNIKPVLLYRNTNYFILHSAVFI